MNRISTPKQQQQQCIQPFNPLPNEPSKELSVIYPPHTAPQQQQQNLPLFLLLQYFVVSFSVINLLLGLFLCVLLMLLCFVPSFITLIHNK